jgi:MazG family protein
VEPSGDIQRLIEIMAALRHPDTGCPWDLQQSFASIAPYTVEESYEVADAIERGDMDDLRDELGDLLLQVVYHSRLAEELGLFAFSDVVHSISAKMVNRHPHVFGDTAAADAEALLANWEAAKSIERQRKSGDGHARLLDDVPRALPGLSRAAKLQKRAATVGFDWPDSAPVFDKIREEIGELETELAGDASPDDVEAELGDVLFSIVNLSRRLGVDAEQAMQRSNNKFRRRFGAVEDRVTASGNALADATAAELEAAWNAAKAAEKPVQAD